MGTESSLFLSPKRVLVGAGARARIAALLRELEADSGVVAVVADATLRRRGLAAELEQALAEGGFKVQSLDDVSAEPTTDFAEGVVEAARRADACAVVGLGGGSSLDLAKLSAAMVRNPGPLSDYSGERQFARAAAPFVLIPTTAGSGSEATSNAVLSRAGRKFSIRSPRLVACGVILDPVLTVSLPQTVTAWTGLDALSHCVEALLSTRATSLTDATASRGIELVHEFLPRAYQDGADVEVRAQMQIAAFLGGLSLNAGTVVGHAIAYTLAERLHLPHGLSCALALPACVAYNATAATGKLAMIGRVLGIRPEPPLVVAELLRFATSFGVPVAWRTLGLAHEDLSVLADECAGLYARPSNPRPMTRAALERVYEAAWDGALVPHTGN